LSVLVSFSVSNFRSVSERIAISFRATEDDTNAESLVKRQDFNLAKVAGVYGANASGKSNLLKSLALVRDFVLHSATGLTLGDEIPGIVPFRLDSRWVNQPSSFEISVEIEGAIYDYAFSATASRVHHESLHIKQPGGKRTKRFSRDLDLATQKTEWVFRGFAKKDESLLRDKTRDNGLLLSRAADLNFEQLGNLFLWFKRSLWTFDFSSNPAGLSMLTSERIKKNDLFRRHVLKFLRDADFGIGDIAVNEEELAFPKSLPEEFKAAFASLQKRLGAPGKALAVSTTHFDTELNPVRFSLESDESNGTQRFYAIAGPILDALREGAVLSIDELECSMHPNLTRKLVALFNSPVANRNNAQLLFSSHDVSLLDSHLLRRDQVWFTAKLQAGETELFRLYDVGQGDEKPRKQGPFLRNYLHGRYGAVPSFGPMLEDMEFEWNDEEI
jgi:AAA15 family ATPase/GTPase